MLNRLFTTKTTKVTVNATVKYGKSADYSTMIECLSANDFDNIYNTCSKLVGDFPSNKFEVTMKGKIKGEKSVMKALISFKLP